MVYGCENGQFFNENRQECDNPENLPPPCGTQDLGSILCFFSNENINLDLALIPKKNLCDECDKVLLECLDFCDNVPTCISDCNRDHITCIDTC